MTVHHAITWAHMTALEHGGHDKFLPSLSNPELRFTMASIREHFSSAAGLNIDETLAWSKCQGRLTAATATLERVRAYVSTTTDANADLVARRVLNILAGQPEAPKGQELTNDQRPECFTISKRSGLERLKPAPGFDAEHSAQIRERMGYKLPVDQWDPPTEENWADLHSDLAAAKARIAEQQHVIDACSAKFDAMVEMRDERDAAERRHKTLSDWFDACRIERDRLAARVKRLEEDGYQVQHPADLCTPPERAVLEAMADLSMTYLVSNVDTAHCVAELANRAAKAKRGGQ